MGDERIARRAQDIHAGLRDYDDPLVSTTVPITTLIGRAALLAVHLRGLERIRNIGALYRIASTTLGISSGALPPVLRILQQAGWIRVVPNEFDPKEIEENIPVFHSLYEGLSDQWTAMKPGELDQASIALVDALSSGPVPVERVVKQLGVDDGVFLQITEVGQHGGYVRTYGRATDGLVYSPLYAEEHPEALLSFVENNRAKFPEIHSLLKTVSARPGLSVANLQESHPVVIEMVDANVICAPAVTSAGGTHSFLFPPIRDNVDRAIIQKARVLVACVRYGQHFGGVTKISDPAYLLSRLQDTKLIGRKPHSHIKTQYSPAADLGIGYIQEHAGRYSFHLYDTQDNMAAVQLAIRLVQGATEPPAHRLLAEDEMQLQVSATETRVVLPEENRQNTRKAKKTIVPAGASVKAKVESFMDDLRGVRRVR